MKTQKLLGRKRGQVKADIVSQQRIPNPIFGPSSEPVARVETTAPDGFGCDIGIIVECASGPHGGNDHPQLSVRLKFEQQHAAELHDWYGNDLVTDLDRTHPSTITLHAWGQEAYAIPAALRKAADAVEAGLKAEALQLKPMAA